MMHCSGPTVDYIAVVEAVGPGLQTQKLLHSDFLVKTQSLPEEDD
jgi:hypothetical protein